MTESDHTAQTHAGKAAGFTHSTAFVVIVGLWFATLFGGGCLLLPPVLFDAAFSGAPPFGPNTRIVFVAAAAVMGLLLGLFIASRVRSDDEQAPRSIEASAEPERKTRKRKARAPLDIRAALGMVRGVEDEDEDADEVAEEKERPAPPPQDADYELTDEIGPPIDDPYFASAWSDSGSHDTKSPVDKAQDNASDESVPLPGHNLQASNANAAPDNGSDDAWPVEQETAQPTPVPQPSRYNPFADFVSKEEPVDAEPRRKEAPAAQPLSFAPAAQALPPLDLTEIERMMSRPTAPPPPPVWPAPRAEEPELQELGVAELVERLARALQGEAEAQAAHGIPPRTGAHRHESALAPKSVPDETDIDRALRVALDRLTRLDDVA